MPVNVRALIPVLLMLVAWIFLVAATATSNWAKDSVPVEAGSKVESGLWKVCYSNGPCQSWDLSPSECSQGESGYAAFGGKTPCNNFFAARAFLVLACLFGGLCIIAAVVPLVTASLPLFVNHLGLGLAVATFLTALIGFATGTAWSKHALYQLGINSATASAGVAVSCIAWILALASVGAFVVFKPSALQANGVA